MVDMNLTEKYIQRIEEYFKALGWSDEDILKLIDYLIKP